MQHGGTSGISRRSVAPFTARRSGRRRRCGGPGRTCVRRATPRGAEGGRPGRAAGPHEVATMTRVRRRLARGRDARGVQKARGVDLGDDQMTRHQASVSGCQGRPGASSARSRYVAGGASSVAAVATRFRRCRWAAGFGVGGILSNSLSVGSRTHGKQPFNRGKRRWTSPRIRGAFALIASLSAARDVAPPRGPHGTGASLPGET